MTQPGGKEPEAAADAIPARTTPTWEMEMLLSGASVFGLLQAPGYLNTLTDALFARIGSDHVFLVRLLVIYLAAAVYALLATFIAHLLVRAVWIATVGVRSMFPLGPDATRMRGGPVSRRVAMELPTLTQLIDRLDNLATIVFALGAITAMGALISAAIAGPLFAIDYVAESRLGERDSRWSMIGFGLLLAPLVLTALVDQLFGARLAPDSRLARMLAASYRGYRRIFAPTIVSVLLNTLMTRLGTLRVLVVYMGALMGLLLIVVAQLKSRTADASFGDYVLWPTPPSSWVVRPYHYLDQRRQADAARLDPYLDSMRATDDWMRVHLPFDAGREGIALREACAQLAMPPEPAAVQDATAAQDVAEADVVARVACLAGVHDLRIDGALPTRVDYSAYIDPDTGVRGLLAMVDVSGLDRGRHVVQVRWLPTRRDLEAERTRPDYRIPFWK